MPGIILPGVGEVVRTIEENSEHLQVYTKPELRYPGTDVLPFTRPANTTPYAAHDVIGTAFGSVFPTFGKAFSPGGTGYVTGVKLYTTNSAWSTGPQLRIHFFSEIPFTHYVDNAAFDMTDNALVYHQGWIDLLEIASGGAGSNRVMYQNNSDRVPYKCNSDDIDADGVGLYYMLETLGVATPVSAQEFGVYLTCEVIS